MIEFFQTSQNTYRVRLEAIGNVDVQTAPSIYVTAKMRERNDRLKDIMQIFGAYTQNLFDRNAQLPTNETTFDYINDIVRIFVETS
jgi:hypothetical protein